MTRSLAIVALVLGSGLLACSGGSSSFPPADGGSGVDAGFGGDAGCSGAKPACPEPCDAGFATPECLQGAWVCPPEPAIACVANEPDAGFACGSKTCDRETTYCLTGSGGPPPLEGGSGASYSCAPLSCDGGAVGCSCVGSSTACSCTDDNGAITVVCNYP